jgi:hypothetical protein
MSQSMQFEGCISLCEMQAGWSCGFAVWYRLLGEGGLARQNSILFHTATQFGRNSQALTIGYKQVGDAEDAMHGLKQ